MKTEHLDQISDVQKATEKRSHNVSFKPHQFSTLYECYLCFVCESKER